MTAIGILGTIAFVVVMIKMIVHAQRKIGGRVK